MKRKTLTATRFNGRLRKTKNEREIREGNSNQCEGRERKSVCEGERERGGGSYEYLPDVSK